VKRGNSLGGAPLGGSDAKMQRGTGFSGKFHQRDCPEKLWVQDVEIAWGELRRERATLKMHSRWRVFQDKFHQYDCFKKLCAQDLSKFPNPGPWDMHSFVDREQD